LNSLARIQVDCDGLGLGNFLEFPNVEDTYQSSGQLPVLSAIVADAANNGDQAHLAGSNETETRRVRATSPSIQLANGEGLALFNGLGGFNDNGEYEIRLSDDVLPPAPWVNVVGNPSAGFIVSESGTGSTWAQNSYFYRLTPWHNDPVRDPTGDCIYLRDDDTDAIWTPTRSDALHREARCGLFDLRAFTRWCVHEAQNRDA
jgi:cyclic beta-1,2-glucan synthetase